MRILLKNAIFVKESQAKCKFCQRIVKNTCFVKESQKKWISSSNRKKQWKVKYWLLLNNIIFLLLKYVIFFLSTFIEIMGHSFGSSETSTYESVHYVYGWKFYFYISNNDDRNVVFTSSKSTSNNSVKYVYLFCLILFNINFVKNYY